MNTIANETPEDIRFKKFMRTFDGYLIARVISREYDASRRRRRGTVMENVAAKIRGARGEKRNGDRGIGGN